MHAMRARTHTHARTHARTHACIVVVVVVVAVVVVVFVSLSVLPSSSARASVRLRLCAWNPPGKVVWLETASRLMKEETPGLGVVPNLCVGPDGWGKTDAAK